MPEQAPKIDDLTIERTAIKLLVEAHRQLLLLKLDNVLSARKEFKTIPLDLYDAERVPAKRQEKTFLLSSGTYSHHGFCRPLIEETLEHIIALPEDKFKYLNYCKAVFQDVMAYRPEGGIALGHILMTATYYYTPMMNYLHDNNFKAYVALEQSALSAASFLRWLNGQIEKYRRWIEFNKVPKNETETQSKSSQEIQKGILPKIEDWKELCLGNINGLAIYIGKKGSKGRDYTYIELHLGDTRRNAAAKPIKTWHAIRFYAFGDGIKEDFNKTDFLRANKAFINLFQMPSSAGKPFPILKSGIIIINQDALDRQTTKHNDEYSGKSEAECANEAQEMQFSSSYDGEEKSNID
jgi:hypothetical protein